MKTIAVLTLCLLGVALAGPNSAVAQCTTGTFITESSGSMLVGDIPGVSHIIVGQQFTVDCRSQFLSATFLLTVDPSWTFGSQSCLAQGDTIAAVLMDMDHNELARVERTLNFSTGTRAVTFDFSGQTYGVDPGDYVIAWENVTKSYLIFGTYTDVRPGCLHVSRDGVWGEEWTTDAYFEVHWDAAGVPNDEISWSALKADYR